MVSLKERNNFKIVRLVIFRMDKIFLFLCGFLNVPISPVYNLEILYAYEGESILLMCPFTANNNTTVWYGPPENKVYSYDKDLSPLIPRGDRLELFRNSSSEAYNLQITNLKINEDEGIYRCVVESNPKYQQKNISLKFYIDVHNVSLSPRDNPLTIKEGVQTKIMCIVNSNADPLPTFLWYLISPNTSTIVGANSTDLFLTGNRADNKKMLQCKASNSKKPEKTTSTTLNVEYVPNVSAATPSPYRVHEGKTATLKCSVTDGNPKTGITWKWYHEKSRDDNLSTKNIFNISDIRRNMSGLYTCTAKNAVGWSPEVTVDLDVQYKPDVLSATPSPYRVPEGETATLECRVIAANPKTILTWNWFHTDSPSNVFHSGPNFTLPNILRDRSGSYNCTATNFVGTSQAASIEVDVQYKPDVSSTTPSPYRVLEGETATLECRVIAANPITILTWNWFHTDRPHNVFHSGPNFTIPNIDRNRSGSYNCTANNTIGTSQAASIEVDVQYKPVILEKSSTVVNESEKAVLIREISSNPLSNVSWFRGETLLNTQFSVKNALYVIQSAKCTDTTNFTILASNIVKSNVSSLVELIVKCKPQSSATNITLGVTDITGLEFATTVIAYPKPQYELQFENGTKASQMTGRITANSMNNFTIYYNQTVVEQDDYGTYHLRVKNLLGEAIIYVNVIPQRKPNMPVLSEVVCEVTRAIVKWKSTFNGGDVQLFTAIALNGFYKESDSGPIADKGENEIHSAPVQNLRPSTKYLFYVSANNSHGESSSKNISCTTVEETSVNLQLVAGGAAAGGISLGIIIIVIVILLRKYTTHEKQTGKSQRFKNEVAENEEVNDDGMRDNILYVSAGPKVDEKPEAAVYASVNKKAPESNNNANVYADVNKSGHNNAEGALYSDVKPKRGLFKKDVSGKKDGNPKQKKGKKQKSKQDVADVYENSEDIAMSSKSDNVYSNTVQKVQNKEERGYKNKDGLLYVEVQFDAKTEKGNQTIHGEDEKTDYATVEFPMAASKHDESGNEKI